jgi:hypothetical protein
MATAGELITAAFNKVGVYSPTTAQMSSGLTSLNIMLSGWNPEILQPALTFESLTLTAGDREYTIGTTADLVTTRPLRIESAFLRDSDNYDWPLEIVAAKDANAVTYKATEARPEKFYYIPEETNGKIFFECEPDEAYTLYLESWKPFTECTASSTTFTLANEYKEAIVYNLAISLAEDWDRQVPATVVKRAEETKYLLSAANAATRPVPKAKFDMFLGHAYNIETDT